MFLILIASFGTNLVKIGQGFKNLLDCHYFENIGFPYPLLKVFVLTPSSSAIFVHDIPKLFKLTTCSSDISSFSRPLDVVILE